MRRDPLRILYFTLFPAGPPRFGAQRRIQGLMSALARRHAVTAVSLIEPDWDAEEARRAMGAYCEEVVLVPGRRAAGLGKRLLQLRSLLSARSFEHHFSRVPAAQRALDDVLSRRRFDVVNLEAPYLAHYRLRQAPPGAPPPVLTLDNHNIEHDLVRQMGGARLGLARRVHNSLDWRKVRREELAAWRAADGVAFTSAIDEARARADVPELRARVIANAVDVRHFRPSPELPAPDGQTVLFFGTVDYFPNRDGLGFFFEHVWPLLSRTHPRARLQIVGPRPTPEVLARRGPRVEVTGMVDDLRPHLAQAAVVIAPLRIGGGTRLKILEGMAMAKAVVSTPIGAEGIEAVPERDLVLAEGAEAFAAAVGCVLDDAALADRLGRSARALVEARYSWDAAGDALERFFEELIDQRRAERRVA
jgi:glycosyltransferase involved in cell wall biosynthesis